MNRNLRRIAGAGLAAVLTTAAANPLSAATTGTLTFESPGRTMLVYWHAGSTTLSFYDVEARKTSNLDVKFPADFAQFAPSGQFLCLRGHDAGRLAVLDVAAKRIVLSLKDTAHSSYYCEDFNVFADPSQPTDSLAGNALLIEHVVTSGPPSCGTDWTVEKVTDFFLDPRPKTPKVVRQFTWTDTAC